MPRNNNSEGSHANSQCSSKKLRSKAAKDITCVVDSLEQSLGPLGMSCAPRLDIAAINGDFIHLMPKAETKLYHRRWFMLFLFLSLSASNGFMWLEYSIISNIFMRFYNVEAFAIDWLSLIYLLTYIPLILPVIWFLDVRGIRETILIGAAFNCIGAWIKTGSAHPDLFAVTFFGHFICSIATVFILGIPSYIASVWFGDKEVSTACCIGVLGNQVMLYKCISMGSAYLYHGSCSEAYTDCQ